MDDATREFVRVRARAQCEYCGLRQADFIVVRFQVEHVVAKKHGGGEEADNLALACMHCNLHKGPNLSGIDPLTGELTRLFHPRRDDWRDHFRVEAARVVGLTNVGRTTIRVLNMNLNQQVQLREAVSEIVPPVE